MALFGPSSAWYLVAYCYKLDGGGFGLGSCTLRITGLLTREAIQDLTKHISQENKEFVDLVILNIVKLES